MILPSPTCMDTLRTAVSYVGRLVKISKPSGAVWVPTACTPWSTSSRISVRKTGSTAWMVFHAATMGLASRPPYVSVIWLMLVPSSSTVGRISSSCSRVRGSCVRGRKPVLLGALG